MSDVLMEVGPAPAELADEPAALPELFTAEAEPERASTGNRIAEPPARWIGTSGFLIDSQRKVIEHCRQQLAAVHLADQERERLERVRAVAEAELVRLQPSVIIPPGWVDRLSADISAGRDVAASDPPGPVAAAGPIADSNSLSQGVPVAAILG